MNKAWLESLALCSWAVRALSDSCTERIRQACWLSRPVCHPAATINRLLYMGAITAVIHHQLNHTHCTVWATIYADSHHVQCWRQTVEMLSKIWGVVLNHCQLPESDILTLVKKGKVVRWDKKVATTVVEYNRLRHLSIKLNQPQNSLKGPASVGFDCCFDRSDVSINKSVWEWWQVFHCVTAQFLLLISLKCNRI